MKPVTWIPPIGVLWWRSGSGHYEWRLDHFLAAVACMVMSGPLLLATRRPSTTTTTAKSTRSMSLIGRSHPSHSSRPGETPDLGSVAGRPAWPGAGCSGSAHHTGAVPAGSGRIVRELHLLSRRSSSSRTDGWAITPSERATSLLVGRSSVVRSATWATAIPTLAYSLAGLGIAVVNDFKSVEGDRELGLQSPCCIRNSARKLDQLEYRSFSVLMAAVLIAMVSISLPFSSCC